MKPYGVIAMILAAALVLISGYELFNDNIAESKEAAEGSLSKFKDESAERSTEAKSGESRESEESSESEEEPADEELESETESEEESEEVSEADSDESKEEPASENEATASTAVTEPEPGAAPTQASIEPAPTTQPTAPTTPTVPAATSIDGTALVQYAMQFVGKTPYLWGGEDPVNGADCSGVVVALYRHFGVSVPHYSGSLTDQGSYRRISPDEILPGDIIGSTGGEVKAIDDPGLLPGASVAFDIASPASGFIASMNASEIGMSQ